MLQLGNFLKKLEKNHDKEGGATMAECPKCNAEIDHLEWKCYKMTHGELYFNGINESGNGSEATYFFCPICQEKLFESEDETTEFLKEKTAIQT